MFRAIAFFGFLFSLPVFAAGPTKIMCTGIDMVNMVNPSALQKYEAPIVEVDRGDGTKLKEATASVVMPGGRFELTATWNEDEEFNSVSIVDKTLGTKSEGMFAQSGVVMYSTLDQSVIVLNECTTVK